MPSSRSPTTVKMAVKKSSQNPEINRIQERVDTKGADRGVADPMQVLTGIQGLQKCKEMRERKLQW